MFLRILLMSVTAFAEDAAILRPLHQTLIPVGAITVVARGPATEKLLLDGKPVDSQQPSRGIFSATIQPAAGIHELMLGTARIQFAVGTAPAAWKPFRQHPPAAACTTCHTVKNGAWEFANEKLADICSGCHDLKAFPKLHMHNTEVLKDCQECHQPHGSAEKSHLKLSKETACKLCHG